MATSGFRSTEGRFRLAWEPDGAGIPQNANWHDVRISPGEDLAQEATFVDTDSLNPGAQRSIGAPSKFNEAGSINFDPEPDGLAYILAQIQEKGSVATLTASQSFRHLLAPTESTVDFGQTQTLRMWRDDAMAQTFLGARWAGLQLNVETRGKVSAVANALYERAHYYDFATVVAEGATPTRPLIRGLPKHDNWVLADHDVYVKVTDITNFPTDIGLDVKVGSGSSYGTINLRVTPQTWTEIKHPTLGSTIPGAADTDGLGEPDSPVEIYFDALDQALNDEWKFIGEAQDPWTPAFPVLTLLNEIHVAIQVSDVVERMRSCQLNYSRPLAPDENLGGRFNDGILVLGNRVWSGQLDRRYVSTKMRKRLEAGEPFKLFVELASRQKIGTSDDVYRITCTSPLCLFTGRGAVISSADDYPEPLPFQCYEDPTNGTDPADMNIRVDNSISDLTT